MVNVPVRSLQLCLPLCDPTDRSLPGFSVHRILQARIPKWVAMPSSRGSSQPRDPTMSVTAEPVKAGSLPLTPPGKPQVQFSRSVVSDSASPWTAAHQASLSITNSWSLLKLMCIEWVMPSNHLILCHPLLLLPSIFASIRVSSEESVLRIRWPKYWSFSFSISPSNEYAELISFRMDWFDLLQSRGLSRVFSITTVQKHQFLDAQLSF